MIGKEKYFRLLGIKPTTDINVIKKAYRKQALKYHPDRNRSADAHFIFIQVTEAYELITDQRKFRIDSGTTHKPKTVEEILAEKVAVAKERWRRQQAEEIRKDNVYFEQIAFGWKWHIFGLFAIYSACFSILLSCDYFLDGEEVSYSNLDQEVSLDLWGRIVIIKGEYFLVNNDQFWFESSGKLPMKVTYSYLFHDLKALSIMLSPLPAVKKNSHSNVRMRKYIDFEEKKLYGVVSFNSVYGAFPVLHIMFLVPLLLVLFKRPNLRFSIWRLVSIWIIFPTNMFFTLSNDRIIHFIHLVLEG